MSQKTVQKIKKGYKVVFRKAIALPNNRKLIIEQATKKPMEVNKQGDTFRDIQPGIVPAPEPSYPGGKLILL